VGCGPDGPQPIPWRRSRHAVRERSERTRRSKKVVVYELYGLTDEEIEIVEKAVGE